jgi:oxygen-independent coproporphyrinogen-3 oxidase
MQETLMLGLRLTQEGVSEQSFQARFGQDLMDVFGQEIDELIAMGLLEFSQLIDPSPHGTGTRQGRGAGVRERAGMCVRLTRHGRLLGNQVFLRFVD